MRRIPLLAGLAALVLATAGCDDKQDVFSPRGDVARSINTLQVPVFIIAGVVGVFVLAAVVYLSLVGVRRRKADEDDPKQIEGNFKLEITWTILPAVLLAVIGVFTVGTLLGLDDNPAGAEPIDGMQITVYGQQWWWAYEYEAHPEDTSPDNRPEVVTANDLVIPAGVRITLNIESRDVIHSFWIPALAGTRDAVPGRVHTLVIEADQPGIYDGQCKEYCGLSHANMKQRVVALSMQDFETWFAQQQEPQRMLAESDPNYAGQQIFLQQCTSCHQINGLEIDDQPLAVEGNAAVESHHAPNLTYLMSRGVFAGALFDLWVQDADGHWVPNRQQLEAWIRDPAEQKPMYDVPADPDALPRGMPDRGLTETEIDQVVDYLLTLNTPDATGPLDPTAGADD